MELKIIEITEENQKKYINQLEKLELKAIEDIQKNGNSDQLLITGKKEILQYIESSDDIVLCLLDDKNKITSSVYLTQGQLPFMNKDFTKYFKYGNQYRQYVKSNIGENYGLRMMQIYNLKLQAFDFAKRKILSTNPQYKNITEYIDNQKNMKNGFDEKNCLRDNLNKYMSFYMKKINALKLYENFYWISLSDIVKEIGRNSSDVNIKNNNIKEYEYFLENEKLSLYDINIDNPSKYYNCNTLNTIQIDKYITDPKYRNTGFAKILVYEGIKNKLLKYFENESNKKIYLSSIINKDNISSRYILDFFELEDNLSVKNSNSIDEEVHICCIERENYKKYLNNIKDKLIVLYGYNPTGKNISKRRKEEVLLEQLEYERKQYVKLNKIRNNNTNYKGQLSNIMPKLNKIGNIKQMLKDLRSEEKGDNR